MDWAVASFHTASNGQTLIYGCMLDFVHLEMWVVFSCYLDPINQVCSREMCTRYSEHAYVCLQPTPLMLGVMRQMDDVMKQIIATSVELLLLGHQMHPVVQISGPHAP